MHRNAKHDLRIIKKQRIMMAMFGIIMVTLQNSAHAFNIHANAQSPLEYGIIMTALSTHLSLYIVNKAPLPQPDRRKVIQTIGCCAAISMGEFIHETKKSNDWGKIEPNLSNYRQQQKQQKQTHKIQNDDIRITRGHLGSRHEFLSQLLQETKPLRGHYVHQGLLQQDDVYQERQA